MSFCPNCGSYVSPGTNICSCGTTFGYDSEPEKEEETEFQKQEKKRINTTDEYCRQGRKLMDNGDFLKAIEYFDKALEISPKYYPPTFNKAKAYRLGEVNKETKYVLDYFKVEEPELLSKIDEGEKV